MDFNRLRSFVVVAETGHLTRAAEKLHISQPALSAQIRALEDELDLTLFERTSTGMTLTAAGKRLLEIDFQHEITGVALQRVRDATLEASFYYGNMPYPQVAGVALREMVYRIVAPAAWRERVERAGWPEIAELPWIMPPPVSSHHQFAATLFSEHGVEATRLIGADDEAVVSSLVTSGAGVALMREEVALQKAHAGEVCLWQDTRVGTTLRFVYRRSRELDPLIRALLDVLKETWRLRRDAVATRRKPGRQTAARIPGTKES